MKYKVFKTILWAIDPPNPGEYELTKGKVVDDIPEHLISEMLEKGYIEEVKKEENKPRRGRKPGSKNKTKNGK